MIHLAAQPFVRRSYREPVETFATNVMGTANLLEACRGLPGLRGVLVITTDKCYENHEDGRPYREDDPLGGHDPYSASKACAELITGSYRRSFFAPGDHARHGVAVASARAGNVIGGGDWGEDRLVPDAIRAFQEGREVTIRNPQAIRPWQFVLAPLAGYLRLARALCEGGPSFARAWNFAPDRSQVLSVRTVAEQLVAAWGPRASWTAEPDHEQLHEARLLLLDAGRARAELGWSPHTSFARMIELTVRGYQHCYAGLSPQTLRSKLIAQIEERASEDGR